MTRPLTVREVLAASGVDATLTPEAVERVRASLTAVEAGAPWYLRLLMGIGAWFGTWFLLGFVLGALAIVFEGAVEGAATLLGLLLVGGAVLVRRQTASEFLQQIALVVSLTGQGLFVGGIGAASESVHAAAVAGFLISIPLIVLFPDRVHRFLSTLGMVIALAALAFEVRMPHGGEAIVIGLLALVLAFWKGAPLAWRTDYAEAAGPVASGAIISIFGLLLLASVVGFVGMSQWVWLTMGGPVTAAAVLGLLWLVHEVMDEHEPGRFGAEGLAAFAAVIALAAITWRTPAIVTTLLVITLAFDRRSRSLLALGIAFFLAFGALYYYNLEMTLLQKSGILAGSGALCLLVWAIVRRMPASSSELPV